MRGRLRRLHFSLFKRSGIAYVSAIKRRLRIPGLEFSVSIQALVNFLEGKEGLLAHQLPEQYLGITVPEQGVVLEAAADQALKTLMQDLHWLIREGYVAEFNDGRLSLSPLAASAAAAQSHNEAGLDEHSKEAPIIAEGQKGFEQASIAETVMQPLKSLTANLAVNAEVILEDDSDTTFALEAPTAAAEEDRPGLDDDI